MQIDSSRLKELRQGKGLSRAQLADRSKISQRQITRIENDAAAAGNVRERTVTELAGALGVESGVLTGDLPMPDAGSRAHSGRGVSRQVSARLQPEASLACALVARRYGVSRTTLFNAAPLMFVLLAEGSLVWRREKVEEVENTIDNIQKLDLPHLPFVASLWQAEEGAGSERESIEKLDLFGENLDEWAYEFGYDPTEGNPFSEYLRHLAAQIDDPKIIEIHKDTQWTGPLEHFPKFSVCDEDFEKFTGGDLLLRLAAELGFLQIDHVPDHLLADDASDERREWLDQQFKEHVPKESLKEMYKLLENPLSLKSDLTEAEGEEMTR